MKVAADNSTLFAAQDRRSSAIADRTRIADQNRANADVSDKVNLQKDSVNVRSNGAIEISPLETVNLQAILEKLTLDIFGNEKKALDAQGNLDPKAVMALLEA